MDYQLTEETRAVRITVLLLLVLLLRTLATGAQSNTLTGFWSETCPCAAPCPCWTETHTKVKRCLSVEAYSFVKSTYEGVKLDGLIVVLRLSPSEEYGLPSADEIIVPLKTNWETKNAVLQLFTDGLRFAPRNGMREAAIQTSFHASKRSIVIPGTLEVQMFRDPGRNTPAETVANNVYPWLNDLQQWRTESFEYTELENKSSFHNTNALVAKFRILPRSEN